MQQVFSGVTNQALVIFHFAHDIVANVDAGRTTDTLILQAIANIDSGGTNLHAKLAIDAITESEFAGVVMSSSRTTGLTSF
jgi:hypothetical protein